MGNPGIIEGIILDPQLVEQIQGLEQPAIWLASSMFASECAFFIEGDRERFIVANPEFWAQVPEAAREMGIAGIDWMLKVTMIDDEASDTPSQRSAKRDLLSRYAKAMVEHLRREAGQ